MFDTAKGEWGGEHGFGEDKDVSYVEQVKGKQLCLSVLFFI